MIEPIEIRNCSSLDEMHACLRLQKDVWHFTDAELVPLRLFVVAEKVGGQVIGGFQGGDLVSFILAVPGFRHGYAYLHSHMLAVREDHRNTGLGQRMKWHQREEALRRGFQLIEWTFDPLEIKNSFLNIENSALSPDDTTSTSMGLLHRHCRAVCLPIASLRSGG